MTLVVCSLSELPELHTTMHSLNQRRLSLQISPYLNLRRIVLWHHKLLPHLEALPFLLPGLDLSRIERPLVQMVFLLLLLKEGKRK